MSNFRKFSLFPKGIKACIEPLTRPVFKAQGLASTRLIEEWENIVGPALARNSVPQKLSFPAGKTVDGTLTIAAGSGFATELQHMQPVILERLSTYFGYKAVSRLTISHTYVKEPVKKIEPRAPRKNLLPKESAQLADEVTDPELKEALQSFAKSLSD